MSSKQPTRSFWAHPLVRAGLSMAGLGALSVAVLRVAVSERGAGQKPENGACTGRAVSCSVAQDVGADGQCVARFGVVSLPGGELFIGAADWEGQTGAERFPRTRVAAFRIDSSEVTVERYRGCEGCAPVSGQPGAPVTGVSAEQAEAFCRSQRGRLPTAAEWVWAAAGSAARRYAWGNSGLVCRRAAFGLEHGPCSEQGAPELSGSRPEGASPEGVLDLIGNAAEWTREARGFAARGGSFRSTAAADLKTWATEACCDGRPAPHIGFRCAYDP